MLSHLVPREVPEIRFVRVRGQVPRPVQVSWNFKLRETQMLSSMSPL